MHALTATGRARARTLARAPPHPLIVLSTPFIMPFIDAKITFRLFRMLMSLVMVLVELGTDAIRLDAGWDGFAAKAQEIWDEYTRSVAAGFSAATEQLRASSRADLDLLDDMLPGGAS